MQKVRYNKNALTDIIALNFRFFLTLLKVLFHLSLTVLVHYRSLYILGSKEDLLKIINLS